MGAEIRWVNPLLGREDDDVGPVCLRKRGANGPTKAGTRDLLSRHPGWRKANASGGAPSFSEKKG